MSLAGKTLRVGDLVRHFRLGTGKIRLDAGETAVIRFDDGLQECDKDELEAVDGPLQEIFATQWHSPIEVVTRAQAAAIESVNDAWGVLSTSRIALLPHQLWVCRRVLEAWPTRWLVADDVGLGKTIEAGLVFWPLIAKGIVRRLLIICPAALVEQWNQRPCSPGRASRSKIPASTTANRDPLPWAISRAILLSANLFGSLQC